MKIDKEVLKNSFKLSEDRFGFWFFSTIILIIITIAINLVLRVPETTKPKTLSEKVVTVSFEYSGQTYKEDLKFALKEVEGKLYIKEVTN